MSKKTTQRLIMFAVGVPTIILPAYYLPHYNFLAFHLEIIITSIVATIEMQNLFSKRFGVSFSSSLISFLGIIIIACGYFMNRGEATWGNIIALYLFSFFALFLKEFIASFRGDFDLVLHRLSAGMFSLTYPWFFAIFFSRIVSLPSPRYAISLFFLIVFFCDSSSWFFGKFLGKGNRGVFVVSPNKSVAGFIGGYLGAMFITVVAYYLFPIFALSLSQVLIVIFFTTTAAIAGDLIESMMKRACNVKDSGSLILGRGGILDSMDSLLFAAPVFYVMFKYFISK
ncbi:MAG: phosphatidate cytidylyltransferase [Treponema sp.]